MIQSRPVDKVTWDIYIYASGTDPQLVIIHTLLEEMEMPLLGRVNRIFDL